MPALSKCNEAPGDVSQRARLPDGVEHSARTIPLGISHLCPPCMTVDGKTYGGARQRRCLCKAGGGKGHRQAACDQSLARGHAGCGLAPAARCCGLHWQRREMVLWFLAQREGHSVRVTFTPQHPETSAAPHETKSVEKTER